MSRSQHDAFIDDSDETCPLCVEEFDLSDRNFKPCPCGYQICQFCFNNIRNNLNGLCPACRRPYSDETIEYKAVSAEEFKAEQLKKNRINNERKIREMQKREVEAQNRKHLAGLRVVQKNLVYVTGLNPRIKEEDLLQTLRGTQYFGQYGKIVKIVVNKRTGDPYNGPHDKGTGMGVYVTFQRKEDAASCIQAVDGSKNGDRTLRATYGTTKYCSAYLRNEQCPNRNCMFLHEPGEEAESFSRLDVSSINSGQKEPPIQQGHSLYAHMHHPPPRTGSASQRIQEDHTESALPATVSWASKNPPTPAARAAVPTILQREHATTATPSPKAPAAVPAKAQEPPRQPAAASSSHQVEKPVVEKHPIPANPKNNAPKPAEPAPAPTPEPTRAPAQAQPKREPTPVVEAPPRPSPKPVTPPVEVEKKQPEVFLDLSDIFNSASDPKFTYVFSIEGLPDSAHLSDIWTMPPLFDLQGGKRRHAQLEQERQDQARREEAHAGFPPNEDHIFQHLQTLQAPPPRQETPQQQAPIGTANAAQPLRQFSSQQQQLQHILKSGLNQQQQQQQQLPHAAFQQQDAITLLQQQTMRAVTPSSITASMGLGNAPNQQQFNAFGQAGQPQGSLHTRQSSRYNFINDTPTASVGIKATANAQHMAQQQQMMPHNPPHAQQAIPASYFNNNIAAPNVQAPPGLKTSTPPVGMSIFGQSGFGNMGLHNASAKVDAGNELLQQLMNRRDKVDIPDPSILQARMAPQHPNHHIQHQTQLQMAGAQSQQDGPTKTVSPPPGLGGTPLPFSQVLQSPAPTPKIPAAGEVEKPAAAPVNSKPQEKKLVEEAAKKEEENKTPKAPAVAAQPAKAVKKRPEPPRVLTNLPLPDKPVDQKATALDSPSTTTSSPAPQFQRQNTKQVMRITSSTASKKNSISGRPGTPGTESVGDTASTTSSVRAASPAPTPVSPGAPRKLIMNTQPQRAKTKSALKKERIQAQKESAREAEEAVLAGMKEEHAPVVSRAKKKDKQKSTPSASRAVSRPPSPVPKAAEPVIPAEPVPKVPEQLPKPEPKAVEKEEPKQVKQPKQQQQQQQQQQQEEKPEPKEEPSKEQQPLTTHLTAAQLLAEMQAEGTLNFQDLDMLKPIVGLSHRFEFTTEELQKFHPSTFTSNSKPPTDEHGHHNTGSRAFVSPGGKLLRGLTSEQQEKYVRYEAEVAKGARSVTRWNPGKSTYGVGEKKVLGKTLRTGELSQYLEEAKKSLQQFLGARAREGKSAEGHGIMLSGKGAGTITVDEAMNCINQLTTLADAEGFGGHGTMHINKAGSTVFSRDFSADESPLDLDQLRDKLLAAMNLSTKLPKLEEITGSLEAALGLPIPPMSAEDSKKQVEESEKRMTAARKEAEGLEKRLNNLLKKNKKIAGVTN